jgi:hypothetical protein
MYTQHMHVQHMQQGAGKPQVLHCLNIEEHAGSVGRLCHYGRGRHVYK